MARCGSSDRHYQRQHRCRKIAAVVGDNLENHAAAEMMPHFFTYDEIDVISSERSAVASRILGNLLIRSYNGQVSASVT